MPSIDMFLWGDDAHQLLMHLSDDPSIAVIIPKGEAYVAQERTEAFRAGTNVLWYCSDPLLGQSNPWQEIRAPRVAYPASSNIPFLGPAVSIMYFVYSEMGIDDVGARSPEVVPLSSLQWEPTQDLYRASPEHHAWWRRFRRWIGATATNVRRVEEVDLKPNAWAFSNAMQQIKGGRARSMR